MLGTSAEAQDVTLKATDVVPGIRMLEGDGGFFGGNLGLITGDDAIILIDDGMEPYSDMLLKAIGEHTDRPVDYVINTHAHGDHVGGNKALHLAGATVVAHNNIRQRLIDSGWQTADGTRPPEAAELPQLTFSNAVTLHLNGHTAHVFHTPLAHTDGDAVIHFPSANVIHTGDILFNGFFPFIDLDSGGSVDGYLAAQKMVLGLCDADTKIIPGHGPLASRADLQAAHDMLRDANTRVKALVDAGKSDEQILADNPLADFHDDWNWSFITTERMTQTLIRAHRNTPRTP
jgi:glyoxylase-like metal-dependent hydrolase (beta-lactamase superfamily II)